MDAAGLAERSHRAVPDREDAEGRWERFGEDGEFPLLALVSALVDKFANGDGVVLDLGCGAGGLARGVCKPWWVMVQDPRARDADPTIGHPTNSRLLRWLLGRRRCCG